jgi:hypothetical protein
MSQKIDVFIRAYSTDGIRGDFLTVTEQAWDFQELASVRVIRRFMCAGDEFHWYARKHAEAHASSDLYILSDDDILPLGKDWIGRAVAVAERNPDYTILAGNNVVYSARTKNQGAEVQRGNAVGSPQLIRRGMIDWSKLSGEGKNEDSIIAQYLKENNLLEGVMVDLDFNHAGHGFSTMNPDYWLKY